MIGAIFSVVFLLVLFAAFYVMVSGWEYRKK